MPTRNSLFLTSLGIPTFTVIGPLSDSSGHRGTVAAGRLRPEERDASLTRAAVRPRRGRGARHEAVQRHPRPPRRADARRRGRRALGGALGAHRRSGCTTRRWRWPCPGRTCAGAGSSFGATRCRAPATRRRPAAPRRGSPRRSGPRPGPGTEIEKAGTDLVTAVERMALVLGLTTALVPILLVVAFWFVLRLRFVRRAGAAQRFLDAAPDLDLFALRADGRPADASPGGDLRRPGRRVAPRRPRRHPRPGPARAEGGRAAPAAPHHGLTRAGCSHGRTIDPGAGCVSVPSRVLTPFVRP